MAYMWGQKEKVKYLIVLAEPEGLNTNNDKLEKPARNHGFECMSKKNLLRQSLQ